MILPFFFPSSNTNAGTQEKLIACPLLTSLPPCLPPSVIPSPPLSPSPKYVISQ